MQNNYVIHCMMQVLKAFTPAAGLGALLGLFPVANVFTLKPWRSRGIVKLRICMYLLVYSVALVTFMAALILQPISYYLKETESGMTLRPTDKFALYSFISCLTLGRLLSPIISVLTTQRLINLLHTFQKYDSQFLIESKVGLVDAHVTTLFVGTLINVLSNWYVSKDDFHHLFQKYGESVLSYKLAAYLGNTRTARALMTLMGHLYGEIAGMMIVGNMMFFVKCIRSRIQDLESDIRGLMMRCESQSNSSTAVSSKAMVLTPMEPKKSRKKVQMLFPRCGNGDTILDSGEMADICSKKLKGLNSLVEQFNSVFGVFVLSVTMVHLALLVSACFLFIIWVGYVLPSITLGNEKFKKVRKGGALEAVVVGIASAFFRCILLTEMGERLQTSGQRLASVIAAMNTSSVSYAVMRQIEDMRWMIKNAEFQVNACRFFVLNRRFILSFSASIATFTVVLTQFRMAETSDQDVFSV